MLSIPRKPLKWLLPGIGISLLLAILCPAPVRAQEDFFDDRSFTRADSLRGGLRPERTCYDVTYYDLCLTVELDEKRIAGYVDIYFRVVRDFDRLQIDLFRNMALDSIRFEGRLLNFQREYDAVFVQFPRQLGKGSRTFFRVYYQGHPREAPFPPWDGGFVWTKDKYQRPWVGVACQGLGASLWWPCKDHLSDEPDSMGISLTVPKPWMAVSNGVLESTEEKEEHMRYNWKVHYPINTYNVTLYIGRYVHLEDTYQSPTGKTLELDHYVLHYNRRRAKAHFQQVQDVLACYESYLGPYPFWEDGTGLVEAPYLGMEHQGAIAYGNKFLRGYLGGMIPRDMDWDYIIVHELGHEYFGNSLSCSDLADIWLHESFTTYLEALYVEWDMDYEAYLRYLKSQQVYIKNREPLVGPYGVNYENWSESDHYYKGAWVLHTMRHVMEERGAFLALLHNYYQHHALSTTDTEAFIAFVEKATGKDWGPFFEQYLYRTDLPVLVYRLERQDGELVLFYRWETPVEGFDMPVLVGRAGNYRRLPCTTDWQKAELGSWDAEAFRVATELLLIETRRE